MKLDKAIKGELDLKEIQETDINEFFAYEQEENDRLEFKQGSENYNFKKVKTLDPIFNTLSAFSNNDGGFLIWGAPQEKEERVQTQLVRKFCQGDIIPVQVSDFEGFTRQVQSALAPTTDHIRIHDVDVKGGTVVLFQVSKAKMPIMSRDKRFYIRAHMESVMAGFPIVDALFKRFEYPHLELCVSLQKQLAKVANPNITIKVSLKNLTSIISAKKPFVDIISSKGSFRNYHINEKGYQRLNDKLLRLNFADPLNYGSEYEMSGNLKYHKNVDVINEEVTLYHGAIDTPLLISKFRLHYDPLVSDDLKMIKDTDLWNSLVP